MRVFALVLGILLVLGGCFKNDFLLSIFSYHNPFMEIFGKKIFSYICIFLGIFFLICALIMKE